MAVHDAVGACAVKLTVTAPAEVALVTAFAQVKDTNCHTFPATGSGGVLITP